MRTVVWPIRVFLRFLKLFHLTVPLTLVSSTGRMNKTEVEVFTQTSISVDDTLVDAMFFLHTLVNPPNTFVGLVHLVSEKLCQMSERGDFKCDNYH